MMMMMMLMMMMMTVMTIMVMKIMMMTVYSSVANTRCIKMLMVLFQFEACTYVENKYNRNKECYCHGIMTMLLWYRDTKSCVQSVVPEVLLWYCYGTMIMVQFNVVQ